MLVGCSATQPRVVRYGEWDCRGRGIGAARWDASTRTVAIARPLAQPPPPPRTDAAEDLPFYPECDWHPVPAEQSEILRFAENGTPLGRSVLPFPGFPVAFDDAGNVYLAGQQLMIVSSQGRLLWKAPLHDGRGAGKGLASLLVNDSGPLIAFLDEDACATRHASPDLCDERGDSRHFSFFERGRFRSGRWPIDLPVSDPLTTADGGMRGGARVNAAAVERLIAQRGPGVSGSAAAANAAGEIVLVGSFWRELALRGFAPKFIGDGEGLFIARFDAQGRPQWLQSFALPPGGRAWWRAAGISDDDRITVTGELSGEIDFGGGAIRASSHRELEHGTQFVLVLDQDGDHEFSTNVGFSTLLEPVFTADGEVILLRWALLPNTCACAALVERWTY